VPQIGVSTGKFPL